MSRIAVTNNRTARMKTVRASDNLNRLTNITSSGFESYFTNQERDATALEREL